MKFISSIFTVFILIISVISSGCTISTTQPCNSGGSTCDTIDSINQDSVIDIPILDTVTVKIIEAKFTDSGLTPGIYVKWVKFDQAMEYNIYYQSGTTVSKYSDYETEDLLYNWHIIDYADLMGPVYTIAVTAVTNSYETSLNNKQTLTYQGESNDE